LAKRLDLQYLSTGALLRQNVEDKTKLGLIADPILARGGYLPDDLMCDMIGEWVAQAPGGWLLDGFPRSVPQAEFLDQQLAATENRLDAALSLEAPFDELLSRISDRVECLSCRWSGHHKETDKMGHCPECGEIVQKRSDDSVDNFTNRFREYERLTQPLAAYYQERGLLCACDATASRDEVTCQLLKQLSTKSNPD